MLLEAPEAARHASTKISEPRPSVRAAACDSDASSLNAAMLADHGVDGGSAQDFCGFCDQISGRVSFPRDLVIVKIRHQYFEFNRGNLAGKCCVWRWKAATSECRCFPTCTA